ncbi:hypothetical protein ACHBTE_28935 [Streptomyces sp. M41]|uniref:hypothetical protein n=1 Tax=Streptomyces sp. M41 TaxID=3059412 RepID=UPI00374CD0E2
MSAARTLGAPAAGDIDDRTYEMCDMYEELPADTPERRRATCLELEGNLEGDDL